jgi:hypothetical protein
VAPLHFTGPALQANQVYQCVTGLGWLLTKADQAADAFGEANGVPALGLVIGVESDEEVAEKKGVVNFNKLAPTQLFDADLGQEARVALVLEVFQRALLQPGLGVDEIPVHPATKLRRSALKNMTLMAVSQDCCQLFYCEL